MNRDQVIIRTGTVGICHKYKGLIILGEDVMLLLQMERRHGIFPWIVGKQEALRLLFKLGSLLFILSGNFAATESGLAFCLFYLRGEGADGTKEADRIPGRCEKF